MAVYNIGVNQQAKTLIISKSLQIEVFSRTTEQMIGIKFEINKTIEQINQILIHPIQKMPKHLFDTTYYTYSQKCFSITQMLLNCFDGGQDVKSQYKKLMKKMKQAAKLRPQEQPSEDEDSMNKYGDEITNFLNTRKPIMDTKYSKERGDLYKFLAAREQKEKDTQNFLSGINKIKNLLEPLKTQLNPIQTKDVQIQTGISWVRQIQLSSCRSEEINLLKQQIQLAEKNLTDQKQDKKDNAESSNLKEPEKTGQRKSKTSKAGEIDKDNQIKCSDGNNKSLKGGKTKAKGKNKGKNDVKNTKKQINQSKTIIQQTINESKANLAQWHTTSQNEHKLRVVEQNNHKINFDQQFPAHLRSEDAAKQSTSSSNQSNPTKRSEQKQYLEQFEKLKKSKSKINMENGKIEDKNMIQSSKQQWEAYIKHKQIICQNQPQSYQVRMQNDKKAENEIKSTSYKSKFEQSDIKEYSHGLNSSEQQPLQSSSVQKKESPKFINKKRSNTQNKISKDLSEGSLLMKKNKNNENLPIIQLKNKSPYEQSLARAIKMKQQRDKHCQSLKNIYKSYHLNRTPLQSLSVKRSNNSLHAEESQANTAETQKIQKLKIKINEFLASDPMDREKFAQSEKQIFQILTNMKTREKLLQDKEIIKNLKNFSKQISQCARMMETIHTRTCGHNCKHLQRFYSYMRSFKLYGKEVLRLPVFTVGTGTKFL